MDLAEFSALDDIQKLDYVIDALKEARGIFSYIYYSDMAGINNMFLLELDSIGDALFEYSSMAELGQFEEIFSDLNVNLRRLRELSSKIRGFN